MKHLLTIEIEVWGDRDPRTWDWPALLDIDDDYDSADFSTLTLTPLEG